MKLRQKIPGLIFRRNLFQPGWGELALAALQWALVSGILLVPAFNPSVNAFESLSRLISGSGFGHFLHSFHSYSGDLFLFAGSIHIIEYIYKKNYQSYRLRSWFFLILLTIVSVLVVFSGFLSTGSLESSSARAIFEGVSRTIEGAGDYIILFFTGPDQGTKWTTFIYIHHAATMTILTVILTYIHIRRLQAERYALLYALFVLALAAVVFPAFIGTAQDSVVTVVKGPWYFIGLQEMLSWIPVFVAGVLFPLVIITMLALLPVLKRSERPVLYLLSILVIFYVFESLIGLFLRGSGWQLLGN